MPITSQVRGWRTEAPLDPAAPVVGVTLSDQAQTVVWRAREVTRVGQVNSATLDRARDALIVLIEGA